MESKWEKQTKKKTPVLADESLCKDKYSGCCDYLSPKQGKYITSSAVLTEVDFKACNNCTLNFVQNRKGKDMNVFELTRANITARDAAEHYGIKVNRNGMACCPFHSDKHPSMKLDQRFHCFGCQADGDAVNFTARLFGLGNYEAALKLLDDFGIPYEKSAQNAGYRKHSKGAFKDERQEQKIRLAKTEKHFLHWISYAEEILIKYQHLLKLWEVKYRPLVEDTVWHPLFVEALQKKSINEYHIDILLNGSNEEKLDFFIMRGRR